MPATALQHFNQDVARARAIVGHADPLPTTTEAERLLRSDVLRSAWMFAVAALDAYYCDAYTDVVAAAAIAKSRQSMMTLPEWFLEIRFPIRAILEDYDRTNWRWRMAARKMMERETVISLSTVQTLFNKFFRKGRRLFRDPLDSWMTRSDARARLFGIPSADYAALSPKDKHATRDEAIDQFEERFRMIFQRRHDCIHNCDRPKVAPQRLVKGATVLKVIEDVEFLARRCDEHFNVEFRRFLVDAGCSAATVALAGY
mgnify:CR=1 FL=1